MLGAGAAGVKGRWGWMIIPPADQQFVDEWPPRIDNGSTAADALSASLIPLVCTTLNE